jgi:hypothetical protein
LFNQSFPSLLEALYLTDTQLIPFFSLWFDPTRVERIASTQTHYADSELFAFFP